MQSENPHHEPSSPGVPPVRRILIFLGAALIVTGLLVFSGLSSYALNQALTHIGDGMTMTYLDNGTKYKVKTRGRIVLTDDDRDIASMDPDGYLIIEVRNGTTRREIEFEPGPDGTPKRTYRLNGVQQDLDPAAKTWLAAILLKVARTTGLDAEGRVRRIRTQAGVDGVLEEIAEIPDGARGHYFEMLAKSGALTTQEWVNIIRAIGKEIESDGHAGDLLLIMADADVDMEDRDVQLAFMDAYKTIDSDGHKHLVLDKLEAEPMFDKMLLLRGVQDMESDGHQAAALISIMATGDISDPVIQPLFLETLKTIQSDGHKQQVLASVWDRPGCDKATLLEGVMQIQSDGHKTDLLQRMADTSLGDQRLRPIFIQATRTIRSEGHLGLIMRKIIDTE